MGITDRDIQDVTEAFVNISNDTGALDDVIKQYDGQKSLAVKIIGSKFKSGFIIKNGTLRMLSELDKPTIALTMDKEKYWDIINSESSGIARAKLMVSVYTEESVVFDPPPGTDGGQLLMENFVKVFSALANTVMGGGS